jgi:hypothetical protein
MAGMSFFEQIKKLLMTTTPIDARSAESVLGVPLHQTGKDAFVALFVSVPGISGTFNAALWQPGKTKPSSLHLTRDTGPLIELSEIVDSVQLAFGTYEVKTSKRRIGKYIEVRGANARHLRIIFETASTKNLKDQRWVLVGIQLEA